MGAIMENVFNIMVGIALGICMMWGTSDVQLTAVELTALYAIYRAISSKMDQLRGINGELNKSR